MDVFGSDISNEDGRGPATRRRRREYQKIDAVNRAAPATPTRTPAITPACDLCCFESGLEDAVDDGCIVEGRVGVASGES